MSPNAPDHVFVSARASSIKTLQSSGLLKRLYPAADGALLLALLLYWVGAVELLMPCEVVDVFVLKVCSRVTLRTPANLVRAKAAARSRLAVPWHLKRIGCCDVSTIV